MSIIHRKRTEAEQAEHAEILAKRAKNEAKRARLREAAIAAALAKKARMKAAGTSLNGNGEVVR